MSETSDIVKIKNKIINDLETKLKAAERAFKIAVNEEPDLPNKMPDEMWEAIRNDRDAMENALKIAVLQTKSGIEKRYFQALENLRGKTGNGKDV